MIKTRTVDDINIATCGGLFVYKVLFKNLRKRNKDQFHNTRSLVRKDSNPSVLIFRHPATNNWRFFDFGQNSGGDAYTLIAQIYKYDLKKEFPFVLNKISELLELDRYTDDDFFRFRNYEARPFDYSHLIKSNSTGFQEWETEEQPKQVNARLFKKKEQDLNEAETEFLKKLGLSFNLLEEYQAAFISGYQVTHDDGCCTIKNAPKDKVWLAYEFQNGAKIYSPDPKRFWYIGKKPDQYLFGTPTVYSYLESPDDIVYLAAGEKDTLVLLSRQFNAMCLNSEASAISRRQAKDWYFESRYTVIVVYDNDNTGITRAKELYNQFHYPYIQIPKQYNGVECKDVTDYFLAGGDAESFKLLVSEQLQAFSKQNPVIEQSVNAIAPIEGFRTASKRIEDAKSMPDIKPYLDVFLQSNELIIFFGDTGKGKSIFAVALCNSLSKGERFLGLANDNAPAKVLYYDFELSDKQFQKRYSDNGGNTYQFSDNFLIDTIDFATITPVSKSERFETAFINRIKDDIVQSNADVIVIDNITFLSAQTAEDSQVAMGLMKLLKALKTETGTSILVLAHTPKGKGGQGVTIDDLAGSKHLSNFADGVFSLAQSSVDKNLRYLIQVKPSRSGEHKFDRTNVLVCEIEKVGCFLTFTFKGFTPESDQLKRISSENQEELIESAKKLQEQGMPYQKIADELGVSKSTVGRWLKP